MINKEKLSCEINEIRRKTKLIIITLSLLTPIIIMLLLAAAISVSDLIDVLNTFIVMFIFLCVGLPPYFIFIYRFKQLNDGIKKLQINDIEKEEQIYTFIEYYKSYDEINSLAVIFYVFSIITFFLVFIF